MSISRWTKSNKSYSHTKHFQADGRLFRENWTCITRTKQTESILSGTQAFVRCCLPRNQENFKKVVYFFKIKASRLFMRKNSFIINSKRLVNPCILYWITVVIIRINFITFHFRCISPKKKVNLRRISANIHSIYELECITTTLKYYTKM